MIPSSLFGNTKHDKPVLFCDSSSGKWAMGFEYNNMQYTVLFCYTMLSESNNDHILYEVWACGSDGKDFQVFTSKQWISEFAKIKSNMPSDPVLFYDKNGRYPETKQDAQDAEVLRMAYIEKKRREVFVVEEHDPIIRMANECAARMLILRQFFVAFGVPR